MDADHLGHGFIAGATFTDTFGNLGGDGPPPQQERTKARDISDDPRRDALEEPLSEARRGEIKRAQDIWSMVEPWYERAKEGDGVIGAVEWGPGVGGSLSWRAWGDVSAFTDEQTESRGLEGNLTNGPKPSQFNSDPAFAPMHLRIEKKGDQRTTAEVTIDTRDSPEKRRLLDDPWVQSQWTFSQLESGHWNSGSGWTTVRLTGANEEVLWPGPRP